MDFQITALTIVSHLLYNVFTISFIYVYMAEIYPKRYSGTAPYVISALITFVLLTGINIINIPSVNAVFSFLMINAISFTMFRAKINPAIFYNVIFLMILFICETGGMILAVMGSGRTLDSSLAISETDAAVGLLTSTVLCFAMMRITSISRSKRVRNKVARSEIIMLIFMLIFEIFILHNMLFNLDNIENLSVILAAIFGFFALNVIVVYEIHQIAALYRVKYEADIIKQQNALQITHYNEMMDNYTHYRRLMHDMRKHMTILTGIKTAENEHYNDYAKALNEKMDMLFDEFQTGNPILSVVMTQKIRAAKNGGIKLVLRLEDVDISFMEDIDITALFANLWDNAIEACLTLPPPSRVITVSLVRREEIIIIQFENSFSGDCNASDFTGGFPVSKKGDDHAGLGLHIIKDVAGKYNGHFIVNPAGTLFTATVMLSDKKDKEDRKPSAVD